MLSFLKNKRVLFITTKNLDYLRNTQEIALIKEAASSVTVIGSMKKSYPKRLLYVYKEILKAKMKDFDVVFVGFSPQLVVPFFPKLRKKELAIDFFISMYDTMVCDRNKFKEGSFAAKLLKWFDRKTLKAADHIITDTKAHAAFFTELGADPVKEITLYLEADTSIYYPRKKKSAGTSSFEVFYFGSILPLQGVPVILEAMSLLKDRKDIHFTMVGPMKEGTKKPVGANAEYIPWLSQMELAEKIAQADLCLAGHFHGSIMKAKRTIPGKAYIYRAMEKPMILGDNAATHELYHEGDEGIYFVPMGDAKALADEIVRLADAAH